MDLAQGVSHLAHTGERRPQSRSQGGVWCGFPPVIASARKGRRADIPMAEGFAYQVHAQPAFVLATIGALWW